MAKTLRPAIVLKGQKEARARRGWASEKLQAGKWSAHGTAVLASRPGPRATGRMQEGSLEAGPGRGRLLRQAAGMKAREVEGGAAGGVATRGKSHAEDGAGVRRFVAETETRATSVACAARGPWCLGTDADPEGVLTGRGASE